jgi:hypothetical protein
MMFLKRGSGNRIEGVHPICFIANPPDPRFKLNGLRLSIADQQPIKEKVLEMMKTIYEKKNPPTAPELDDSCAADDSAKKDDPTPLTSNSFNRGVHPGRSGTRAST